MERIWFELAKLLKDPYLIFVMLVFFLFSYVIVMLIKHIKEQISYERELVQELHKNSLTLERLTVLIETLVHGRGGQNGR